MNEEVISERCTEVVRSENIEISVADSYFSVPAVWNLGEAAQVFSSFSVPSGTLNDVSLLIGEYSRSV